MALAIFLELEWTTLHGIEVALGTSTMEKNSMGLQQRTGKLQPNDLAETMIASIEFLPCDRRPPTSPLALVSRLSLFRKEECDAARDEDERQPTSWKSVLTTMSSLFFTSRESTLNCSKEYTLASIYTMRAIGISFLSLILLVSSTTAKTTMIGLETEEASRGVVVPLDDCHAIEEEVDREVYTVVITKKCRFFTGPMCTGRHTLLQPGEHSSKEPVLIGSVLCEEPDLF
ncbi:hypothetical protein BJX70DRAFT_194747 [Aspergillus crustosus]